MANDPSVPVEQIIVQAATVIIFRNGQQELPELLMVRRSKTLSFAANAAVFPGGKVNAADLTLAGGDDELGARVAAVRETLEETGLVIGIGEKATAQQAIEARKMPLNRSSKVSFKRSTLHVVILRGLRSSGTMLRQSITRQASGRRPSPHGSNRFLKVKCSASPKDWVIL